MRTIAAVTFATTLLFGMSAGAADYFLTVGGGYSPSGNQVSLEKNVLLFQRMLEESYEPGVSHDIYFADGDDRDRDLQFVDPDFEIPKAHRYLADLFNQAGDIDQQYRNHEIPGQTGGASKDNLEKWFNEHAKNLTGGDRLFLYITAHGGKSSDKDQPHDTTLYLWNRNSIKMHDLAGYLDQVPEDVPVLMVMVQCYSGGFAHTIFDEGKADQGLARGNRAGFFATVHDRVAAGCTPDIDEANYHEYSTYFFEALRGKTRFDEPLEKPDFDHDGRTSMAEAHAYVILNSKTIDIPVRTSDAFLRKYSGTKFPEDTSDATEGSDDENKGNENKDESESDSTPVPAEGEAEPSNCSFQADEEAAAETEPVAEESSETITLLTSDSPFEQLVAAADPIDRAILEGLSERLELAAPQRASDARRLAKEIQDQKKELDKKRGELQRDYGRIREEIKRRVLSEWPEVANRWHPLTTDLLTTRSDELVEMVESHRRFDRLEKLHAEIEELDTQKMDLDRRWVKCQRLLRALENVALAANLPHFADADILGRYEQLRAAEAAFFGPVTTGEAEPLVTMPE